MNGCLGKKKKAFNPTWPSTCPYITSVGATTIEPGSNVHEPESAVFEPYPGRSKDFAYTSGGGFSNLYARPSYQKAAVEHYLTKHKPDHPSYGGLATIKPNPAMVDVKALLGDSDGVYNNMGRAYPDVSVSRDVPLFSHQTSNTYIMACRIDTDPARRTEMAVSTWQETRHCLEGAHRSRRQCSQASSTEL